jgi:peptidoglycan/xylan/chitin deacetylase (PgdA/CDA1 family)
MAIRVGPRHRWAVAGAALVVGLVVVAVLLARPGDTPPGVGQGFTASTSAGPSTEPSPSSPSGTGTSTTVPSSAGLLTAAPSSTSGPPAPRTPPATLTQDSPPSPRPSGVPAALRGRALTAVPTTRPVVALTFDAGANSAGLPSILATLADQGVHATFFLTGQWSAADPGGVAAIRSAGHRIGNHSMTHPHLPQLSDAAIRAEVLAAQQAITAAGADPRPLFRFPFGERDDRTIAVVNDAGYVAVRWTVDTLGWKGTSGGISAQQVSDRAVGALRPGEIVLMHIGSNPDDGSTLDADALPGMIIRMRAAGYDFVTLDTLTG